MPVGWQPQPLDRRTGLPLHSQILRQLRAALADGSLQTGDILPPEPELAASLGVARATLRLALRRLANDGALERRRGQGTRVTDRGGNGLPVAVPVDRAVEPAAEHEPLLHNVAELRRQVAVLTEQLAQLRAELSTYTGTAEIATDRQQHGRARTRKHRAAHQQRPDPVSSSGDG